MSDLDLAHVRTFAVVSEERHFRRAGERLGISVSAVTKRIHRLEHAVGASLILRDSGGWGGLTPAGQRFLVVAPALLETSEAAQRAIGDIATMTLRVAVPSGVMVAVPSLTTALSTLTLALRQSHPHVDVQPVSVEFDRITPAVEARDVDVSITFGRSSRSGIVSTRLADLRRTGLVARTHPLAHKGAIEVAEFARYPLLYSPELPDDYMAQFLLPDVRPVEEARLVPIEATTIAHVAHRLLRGHEVTVVPLALTVNMPPELKRVTLLGVPESWYYALRREDDERPELLTAIELMTDLTESITRAAAPR